jgi:LmbE family N-acetylglucosaminyl deacetylase
MIVPLMQEAEWHSLLSTNQTWEPSTAPIVIVSPHPDDETLATGGLIAWATERGIDVQVLAVTDGENAYRDSVGLGPIRQREQEQALKVLGLESDHIVRLHLTDSDISSHVDQLVDGLSSLCTAETQVLAPWPHDFHPDHEACGRVAKQVALHTGASLIYYFFWTWHRGTPALLEDLPLFRFPLNERQRNAKLEALNQHTSQLTHVSGNPILPENLLWPALKSFEMYLPT